MAELQSILVSLAAFVVVLSLVVFVHEYGHFQAARWCRVAIDTFSIGFGKTLVSWRDRHGVSWKIGALPLGGYVKFKDDADPMSSGPTAVWPDAETKLAARRAGLFHAQPLWARAFVVSAGPLANFLFAIAIFAVMFMTIGRDATRLDDAPPRIARVAEALPGVAGPAPGAQAGFRPGDLVRSIDDAPITGWGQFHAVIEASAGRTLKIAVERGGGLETLTVTPAATPKMEADGQERMVGRIGLSPVFERVVERLGPVEAVAAGAAQTARLVSQTLAYIGNIFSGKASANHFAGPLGIGHASGQVVEGALASGGEAAAPSLSEQAARVGQALVMWAAFLSVAVGFANLLPIPVLDGGHLVLYAIEAVRGGKPLPAHVQEWAFRAGLAVLLSLFLFATWNDVRRIFLPDAS